MPPFTSTSAIVIDGENVLVVIDPIRNEPVLPGGHLKWRESPESAVVREVCEETGYQIRVEELFGVFSGVEWAGEPGVVRIVYSARIVGGDLHSSPEGEARWIRIEDVVGSQTRDQPLMSRWTASREAAR